MISHICEVLLSISGAGHIHPCVRCILGAVQSHMIINQKCMRINPQPPISAFNVPRVAYSVLFFARCCSSLNVARIADILINIGSSSPRPTPKVMDHYLHLTDNMLLLMIPNCFNRSIFSTISLNLILTLMSNPHP